MGHILTAHGFRMGEGRMKAIGDLPTPKTVKMLRSVLSMMNLVLKFVPNLAGILSVTPLPKKERGHQGSCSALGSKARSSVLFTTLQRNGMLRVQRKCRCRSNCI